MTALDPDDFAFHDEQEHMDRTGPEPEEDGSGAPLPSPEEQAVIDRFEAAPEPPESLRERLGYYMFQRSEEWRSLCSPEDAFWDCWVDRNREEWREEADDIIAFLRGQL